MTDVEQDIRSELAAIRATLGHIDKVVSGPPPLSERVTRLEERALAVVGLPTRVHENHERGEVRAAVGDERDRNREQLRANMVAIVTIASSVGALIGTMVTVIIWIMGNGV